MTHYGYYDELQHYDSAMPRLRFSRCLLHASLASKFGKTNLKLASERTLDVCQIAAQFQNCFKRDNSIWQPGCQLVWGCQITFFYLAAPQAYIFRTGPSNLLCGLPPACIIFVQEICIFQVSKGSRTFTRKSNCILHDNGIKITSATEPRDHWRIKA
jgi:hypothetical protein